MSDLTQEILDRAEKVIAAIESEESEIVKDFLSRCNGRYRNNKSREYRDYYNRSVQVLSYGPFNAFVRFMPGGPIRRVSRSHLIIS